MVIPDQMRREGATQYFNLAPRVEAGRLGMARPRKGTWRPQNSPWLRLGGGHDYRFQFSHPMNSIVSHVLQLATRNATQPMVSRTLADTSALPLEPKSANSPLPPRQGSRRRRWPCPYPRPDALPGHEPAPPPLPAIVMATYLKTGYAS